MCSCGMCLWDAVSGPITITLPTLSGSGLWTPPEPEPEPPKPPEPEGTIEGSVLGFRAWRIVDWQLYGTGVNRAWVPGVNEATCDRGDAGLYPLWIDGPTKGHPAPHPSCHCGITALARFAENDNHWPDDCVRGAIEAWSDETVDVAGPGDVADAVGFITQEQADELARKPVLPPDMLSPKPKPKEPKPGRFILHGTGFRAQYGKIVLLAIDDDWPVAKKAAVRALAAEHEADVCKREHLKDAALEHGQLVPDELLEWAKEVDPQEVPSGLYSPGYFVPPLWVTSGYTSVRTSALNQARAAFGFASLAPARKPKGPRRKGICQTLGYPGPPQGRLTKYTKGQRVRDRDGTVWVNTKTGKPGQWEQE